MGRRRVANEQEVLALFTSIMRGETGDYVVPKSGEEVVPVPPKLGDRVHAAELLGRQLGLFSGKAETVQAPPPGELEAMFEAIRREAGA